MDNTMKDETGATSTSAIMSNVPAVVLGDEAPSMNDPAEPNEAKKKRTGGTKWSDEEKAALIALVNTKGPELSKEDWQTVSEQLKEQGFERSRRACSDMYRINLSEKEDKSESGAASPSTLGAYREKRKRKDVSYAPKNPFANDFEFFPDSSAGRTEPAYKRSKSLPSQRTFEEEMMGDEDEEMSDRQHSLNNLSLNTPQNQRAIGELHHFSQQLPTKAPGRSSHDNEDMQIPSSKPSANPQDRMVQFNKEQLRLIQDEIKVLNTKKTNLERRISFHQKAIVDKEVDLDDINKELAVKEKLAENTAAFLKSIGGVEI